MQNFRVGPERGLRLAEAVRLPNLMVIAGPNGAGKTSLLTAVHRVGSQTYPSAVEQMTKQPGTNVILIGTHRGWDSVYVSRDVLWNNTDIRPILAVMPEQAHHGASGYGTMLKNRLIRLFVEQRKVQDEYLNGFAPTDYVRRADIPDLFEPLRDLVRSVLPHLRFERVVDQPDQSAVRCLFSAPGTGAEFDIDHLSSGEKAAVGLLFPLVEEQAAQLADDQPAAPPTLLIDEVEQHLHPGLQLQVLHYLRRKAAEGAAQFILTTHSPTLLDALADDELYLLAPATAQPGENQLARLTTSHERLELARELTGSTHLLTRAKPILFVEGEPDRPGVSSDAGLLTQLVPSVAGWSVVSAGSKPQVVDAVRKLRHDQLNLAGTPVFGLVDADRESSTGHEHVIAWPVAMIENLLLDPDAIYSALRPFGAQTKAISPAIVRAALNRAAASRFDDEVRLRVQEHLKPQTLRAHPADLENPGQLEALASREAGAWVDKLRSMDYAAVRAAARADVEAIVEAGTQLDRFRGKEILRAVYDSLGVAGTHSHAAFPSAVAVHAAEQPRTSRLTASALHKISLYFPPGLPAALTDADDRTDVAEALARECDAHRAAWEDPDPAGLDAAGRDALRRRIFEFARTTEGFRRQTLTKLASEIGTP